MRQSDVPEIRALDLFHDLAESSFEALMRGAYLQTFPPGVDLIVEGDPADFLHIVLEGSVELFAAWNRRDTTLAIVRPVESFILAATIRDAPYLMSARTSEKTRLVLLPSSDVRGVFSTDAEFARAVVAELAQGYRSVVKHAKDIKLRSSVERLGNYLLRQCDQAGGAAEFDLKSEKRKIASYLGMTPENMSRAIRALQAYGVEINGQSVTLRSRQDLERFAKPSPWIDDPDK